MKINIADIPRDGLKLDFEERKETLNRVLERDGRGIRVTGPIGCHLLVKRKAAEISIAGYMETRVSFVCSLCLKRFERDVHWDIDYTLVPEQRFVEEKERELAPDELDVSFFTGDVIDTADILMEEFFLEMPIRFICREGCKGLCPRCGADLNQGECACPRERPVDPRLAKLKELKIKSS